MQEEHPRETGQGSMENRRTMVKKSLVEPVAKRSQMITLRPELFSSKRKNNLGLNAYFFFSF